MTFFGTMYVWCGLLVAFGEVLKLRNDPQKRRLLKLYNEENLINQVLSFEALKTAIILMMIIFWPRFIFIRGFNMFLRYVLQRSRFYVGRRILRTKRTYRSRANGNYP